MDLRGKHLRHPMSAALWTERRHVEAQTVSSSQAGCSPHCGLGQKSRRGCVWHPCPSVKISPLHREAGHSPDNDGRERIETRRSATFWETGSLRNEGFFEIFSKGAGENCNLPPRPPPCSYSNVMPQGNTRKAVINKFPSTFFSMVLKSVCKSTRN